MKNIIGIELLPFVWQDKILSSGLAAKKGIIWNVVTVDKYAYVNNIYEAYKSYIKQFGKYWDSNFPSDEIIGFVQRYGAEKDASIVRLFLDTIYKFSKDRTIPSDVIYGEGKKEIDQVKTLVLDPAKKFLEDVAEDIGTLPANLLKPTIDMIKPILIIAALGLVGYGLSKNKFSKGE